MALAALVIATSHRGCAAGHTRSTRSASCPTTGCTSAESTSGEPVVGDARSDSYARVGYRRTALLGRSGTACLASSVTPMRSLLSELRTLFIGVSRVAPRAATSPSADEAGRGPVIPRGSPGAELTRPFTCATNLSNGERPPLPSRVSFASVRSLHDVRVVPEVAPDAAASSGPPGVARVLTGDQSDLGVVPMT